MHLEHDWYSKPLPTNIRLSERTWLYSAYAFCHYGSRAPVALRVGNDTGLYHGTFFDLGPDAQVEIGNYCSLVGVIFATNGRVIIGDYTFIAHEVVVADSHWPSPHVHGIRVEHQAASSPAENCIVIGQNVWIGAQSIVIGRLRIGEGAIIGAGTLVTQDVPPYTICAGNPMQVLRTIPHNEDIRI
jgi:acetyltransferase-like isoleucine patch superfamily enzyme